MGRLLAWTMTWRERLLGALIAALTCSAIASILLYAPQESTMGDVQRIMYLHVAVAWCALAGFLVVGGCGLLYLMRRRIAWDAWAQAVGETGWLCAGLTLISGSVWAHAAWGVWWTWDPRLTATLVLWAVYSGYFLLRSGIEDPHQRARVSAVLAVLGAVDVPLVILATRWFRGLHPAAPQLEPRMRLVLLWTVVSFTLLFAMLAAVRRRQLSLSERAAQLEQELMTG